MKGVNLGLVAGLLLAAGTASGAINYRVNGVAYNPAGGIRLDVHSCH